MEHIAIGHEETAPISTFDSTIYWPVLTMTPEIEKIMDEYRAEHPDGKYPPAYAEHPIGECDHCDALRLLADD